MERATDARILRVHVSESDQHGGQPLYDAIVERCRQLGIAGATVFRGLEGYGESAQIHRDHVMGHDRPVVVVVVDTPGNIARLMDALPDMMQSGLIAVSDGQMLRVQKAESPGA